MIPGFSSTKAEEVFYPQNVSELYLENSSLFSTYLQSSGAGLYSPTLETSDPAVGVAVAVFATGVPQSADELFGLDEGTAERASTDGGYLMRNESNVGPNRRRLISTAIRFGA